MCFFQKVNLVLFTFLPFIPPNGPVDLGNVAKVAVAFGMIAWSALCFPEGRKQHTDRLHFDNYMYSTILEKHKEFRKWYSSEKQCTSLCRHHVNQLMLHYILTILKILITN